MKVLIWEAILLQALDWTLASNGIGIITAGRYDVPDVAALIFPDRVRSLKSHITAS